MTYHVVGCTDCQALWVVEDLRQQDTATCPSCERTHDADLLTSFFDREEADKAHELRARMLADRADELEAYQNEDDYGVAGDRADEYLARHDPPALDAEDLRPIATDRYAGAAEIVQARSERHLQEEAEDALGMYDDRYADLVDLDDWHREGWSLVKRRLEDDHDGDDVVDARTGELVFDTEFEGFAIADLTLDEDTTATGLWATLLQRPGVQNALVDGVRALADGRSPAELQDALAERDVPEQLRWQIDRVARGDDSAALELVQRARRLGTQRASLDALVATAGLVGWGREDVAPAIVLRLAETFDDRAAKQRRSVCRLISALTRHCEVDVIGDVTDLNKLAAAHELDLPAFSKRWVGRGGQEQIDDRVIRGCQRLDDDTPGAQILRTLHAEPTGRLSYRALTASLPVSKATISNWVRNRDDALTELGLVETVDVDGAVHVELTPAGAAVIETFNGETTRQQGLDAALSDPLHPSDHGREDPRTHEAPQTGDPRRKGDGLAPVQELQRWRVGAAAAGSVAQGVSLVDYPVEEAEDYRCPAIGYDPDAGRVVVSAEYVNPMQYWVSIARALSDSRIFSWALTEERMASEDFAFGELFEEYRQTLRSSRCLGNLSDEIDDVGDYQDALLEARATLEDLTTQLHDGEYEDEARFRGEITRNGLGLAGTMIHVMDLCGLDVVRELRLPNFSDDWDADRWEHLTETVATGAAIQSKYNQNAIYRQLFEQREEKLDWTIDASVDADDPFGELIGSIALVGNFATHRGEKHEAFVDDLRSALESPGELREDAPEIEVNIPVQAFDADRDQFAAAASAVAKSKNLRVSRDVVSTLRLFVDTPYDAAEALHWLATEELARELRINEVRYALSKLDADRILPWETSGAQDIVKALLAADRPLSTSELTSDEWADVSRSTLSRDNAAPGDRLKALGLVAQTSEGWRLMLSFRTDGERYETIAPAMITDEFVEIRHVLYDVVDDLVNDPARFGDLDDPITGWWFDLDEAGLPDPTPLLEHWEWLDPWVCVLEDVLETTARTDRVRTQDTVVCFGRRNRQTLLSSTTAVATDGGERDV